MQVKNTMTSAVIGVSDTATLGEALQALLRSKVSALVVFDSAGAPVGILSEGDLLRRAELGTQKHRPAWLDYLVGGGGSAEAYARSHGRRVGEIMTRGIISIGEEAELSEAVDVMLKRNIKRLVVLRAGKAVGVLSRSDLLKALMAAQPDPNAKSTDAQIEAAVKAEIDRQQWAPRGSISISVADGIVTYEGAVSDDRLRDGLRVLAENIPGVKKVRDRLAWIEPNSGFLVPFEEETED
jgi:CBS domain-containing protein